MERKNYVILTSANEWVSTCTQMTMDELKQDVEDVRDRLEADGYDRNIELFIYETVGEPLSL